MNKKHDIKYINEILNELGYILLTKEYKNNKQKLIFKDSEGYLYYSILSNIKKYKSSKFHINNPYTIENIKLWCKLENKSFILLSDTYVNNNENLQWKCMKNDCEEIFYKNWSSVYLNQGCPYCRGLKVGLSNCLATRNPQLASEWHPIKNGILTPWGITEHSGKEVWWKCGKGHEWEASVCNRYKGDKCPYCSGRYPTEENNLLIDNPDLCKEWNYDKNDKRPEDFTPKSHQYVWWKCSNCENEWEARICDRNTNSIHYNSCSKCNNNVSRENNYNWKGGTASNSQKIRQSDDYKQWRLKVFERDNYTCQCCGDNKGGNLQVHHIENFSKNEELRFYVENGITLCNLCHDPSKYNSFHNIYGTHNNNINQLIQYYNTHHKDNYKSQFFDLLTIVNIC